MCGIAGLVTLQEEAAARARLARMSAALVHRGPDGSGEISAGGVHLAHRRLAVIDPTPCGAQPMSNEDGGVWITYNGELYGTGPLRSRLEGRGHRFRSRTDTEVLVHLYEEEGAGLIEQVDGIFAFALHDRRRRTLLLARDRLGVKPLFWAAVRGDRGPELLFGSEVKALLVGLAGRPSLRPEVLGQVLLQGYASAPDTVFEGIRLLPPACFLEIDLDVFLAGGPGQTPSLLPREYWDAPFTGDDARPAEVIEEELAGLLADAVSRQRVADVPLGAFLSGGLDSSLVTALLAQAGAGGAPVRTFTVDVPGADHSEGDKAGRVAAALGTTHTRVDLIAALGGVGAGGATSAADGYWARLAHFDVPWNGSSLLNAWLVSRAAREGGLTVALSGDGGDELFGGYDRYLPLATAPPSPFGRALARAARPLVPAGVRGRARLDALADSEFEHSWTARFPLPVAEAERLTGSSLAVWSARQRALYERHPGDRLARACYLDLKSYLPDHVLAKVDNASMAVSLEVRVPLLDQRVVELAGRIPSGLKVAGGQGKRILRRLARRLELPPEVETQGKTGFDLPLAAWAFGADLPAKLAELARPDARFRALLDGALVDRWIAAARGGAGSRVRVPRRAALWAVYQLERWLAGEAEATGRAA